MHLEDEGLFFCQLCNKDLSHMTPEGRTQHINRCLDEREDHAAPPPPPGVMECPICGKRFKLQKSRASHLKRCSSDMGVPPAVLMQALQRQAEENQSNTTTNPQTTGQKRKVFKANMPESKKPRKKVEDLDEDTMMAMALSSSLLEQEQEKQKESQAESQSLIETTAPSTSKSPPLKWIPNAGKGRSKKRKGGIPRPPPLLMVQDPGAALSRIQARVSALLLCNGAPSPPTPTRCTSTLPGWGGAAPLWQKSALLSVFCLSDFYAPELRDFIVPQETAMTVVSSFASGKKIDTPVQHLKIKTPIVSTLTPASQTGHSSLAVSTPGTGQLPGCSQALQDLMELAEDGMTLTQYGFSTTEFTKDQQTSTNHTLNLHSSGFVMEEEQNNDGVSGFLPETLDNNHKGLMRIVSKQEEKERRRQSLLVSKLALDLGTMVNNPQLSDVQLQVDSGEVYFAHSFMVYVRCPLLAEMIHESGFGVQEEGVPAAQRVLLNDIPGQAVFALLQFLYTAHCSFPSSLCPYVLELASRFDLKDLVEFCQLQEQAMFQSEDSENPNTQTDEAFIELLHSMWNEEDNEDDGTDHNTFDDSKEMDNRPSDREIQEERVNEDELVEIYEFAATQKKREEERDSVEEEKVVDNQGHPEISLSPTKTEAIKENNGHVNTSLDRSYNRLFSETWGQFEEKEPSILPEHKSRMQVPLSACLLSSEMSARTLLQSSASVIDKLSPSPPPTAQNMPIPGVSPGLNENEIVNNKNVSAIFMLLPSQKSFKDKEPELVVLSDSSDDMNIDLTQSSNSPSPQHVNTFTSIKDQNTPNSKDLNTDKMDRQPPNGEISVVDCSAELSWLIPSTPIQPERSVHTSSSQTKSSICRTQLFPKHAESMSKSSISSSETRDRKSCLDVTNDKKLDSSGFAVPQSPSRYSHHGNNSCSHLNFSIPAYSSTPVQTEISKLPPVLTQNTTVRNSPSPEKAEVQGFHLSPLSEQSSSSHCKINSKSSNKSRSSEDCNTTNRENENASLAENDEDCFEAEGGEPSFRQSFLDEPPMAFDDSWGLDACAENPSFSLKLDNSEESVQQQDSLKNIKSQPNHHSTTSMAPDYQYNARTSIFESPNTMSTKTPTAMSPPEIEPPPDINNSLMDSKIWDSWEEEDEEKDVAPPLSERLKPPVQYKTPVSKFKKQQALVPITPMPHYSDMDTPELKNKLNKFGVRPLPKRQMVLKLKEIHQYTHQLVSSDSEDEVPSAGKTALAKAPVSATVRPASCAMAKFKKPKTTMTTTSPIKVPQDDEPLSASQDSTTSSTAESDRSNPEVVQLSDGDSDSDGGISASQSASRLQSQLQAVRTFILSDSSLYDQILQYKPLVLSQLQQQLKAAGIRLGVTKLADYLDSQCITFTTAKLGQSVPSRRRVKKTKAAGEGGVRRKKATLAAL
ncbi:structure-specific endonuclease subunit SLX4 isoform X2 [Boleophthalmus pectinirostris]|nr:structure-specific endonuclease subunit SLX4 isoform X2 [Boleophthalmus pectinirostris]